MSKLDEFNESITSLQQEIENLQAIEQAYKQLAKLVEDYDKVLANLNSATRDMTTTKGELQKQSSDVSEKLTEQKNVLETATAEQRKELEIKLRNIQSLVEQKQNELQEIVSNNADEISSANKKFYNEFAEAVKIRLDDNKLEIKQLIHQDSQGTLQQIADLKTQNQEMQSSLQQQLFIQKKISLAFGIVITILVLASIVMSFIIV